jgi:hypothetical protein
MSEAAEEYFNRKIKEFGIVPPLSADWRNLRNTVKDLLGFQPNSYMESMYPCKAMLSYHIWYRDPAFKEDQYISSSIDISQSIIIVGKPDTPFHLKLSHDCFHLNIMPGYFMVTFLYPECGKAAMFVLDIHIMKKTDLSLFVHKLQTFNWNYFFRDFTKVYNGNQLMHIDVTLSTGASAMPLGICNVLLPRFDHAIRSISSRANVISVNGYWDTYPIDADIGSIINIVKIKRFGNGNDNDTQTMIDACSWHALIGSSLIKTDSGKISISNSIFTNKLINNAIKNLSNTNNYAFSTDKLLDRMSAAPNLFTLDDLVEVELCWTECKIPIDIFMVILGVIGGMMW